jgi:ubiquinone/menaquinone biosynthesis C-methylase UbiE
VLDVGCANGRLIAMLKEKNPTLLCAGIDISEEMVKLATKRNPSEFFISGSAEALPFKAETFDLLICSASFHHFPHPEIFLAEARRVLKPGGKLLIAEIHMPGIALPFWNAYTEKFNNEGDVKVYKPREIRKLMKQSGLQVVGRPKFRLQIQLNWGKKNVK